VPVHLQRRRQARRLHRRAAVQAAAKGLAAHGSSANAVNRQLLAAQQPDLQRRRA
jgi:hypothetical protein